MTVHWEYRVFTLAQSLSLGLYVTTDNMSRVDIPSSDVLGDVVNNAEQY